MEKQSSSSDEVRITMGTYWPLTPSPVYVKIFEGWDTGGKEIYRTICVCPVCLGSSGPIHSNTSEEE